MRRAETSPGWDGGANHGVTAFFAPGSAHGPERGEKALEPKPAPMKVTKRDGSVEWTGLGKDELAVENFVVAQAAPYSLDELRRPFARGGRISASERERREHVAAVVRAALKAGAASTTLAKVLARDKRRITDLARA